MPTTTPLIKVNRTKSYGAEVVLYGDVYDEACAHALELAEKMDIPLFIRSMIWQWQPVREPLQWRSLRNFRW